jgi:hypothetical protein
MVLGPNRLLHTLVQLYEPINLRSPSLHRSIRSFCQSSGQVFRQLGDRSHR